MTFLFPYYILTNAARIDDWNRLLDVSVSMKIAFLEETWHIFIKCKFITHWKINTGNSFKVARERKVQSWSNVYLKYKFSRCRLFYIIFTYNDHKFPELHNTKFVFSLMLQVWTFSMDFTSYTACVNKCKQVCRLITKKNIHTWSLEHVREIVNCDQFPESTERRNEHNSGEVNAILSNSGVED